MILLVLFIFIFLCLVFFISEKYTDINDSQHIDYQVIHLKNSCEKKYNNILLNQEKLGKKINIFNGIYGKNVDTNNLALFDSNIKLNYKFRNKSELGCYLSHLMVYKNASKSNKKFTVLFEDDLDIVPNNLHQEILKIINNIDDNFDLIYLGNLYESKSTKVKGNIYRKNNFIPLYGCHAMLINNKNAGKIFSYLSNINDTVDKHLETLITQNKINAYVIYPSLVNQNNEFESTSRPYYEIIRRQIVQFIVNLYNNITF